MTDHTCPTCRTWWTDHPYNARPDGACPSCTPRVRMARRKLTEWEKLRVVAEMAKGMQGRE